MIVTAVVFFINIWDVIDTFIVVINLSINYRRDINKFTLNIKKIS